MLTTKQQEHLDKLYELSRKYIGQNYDYGNALMSMYLLYQDYYILQNVHAGVWKNYSELVDKY